MAWNQIPTSNNKITPKKKVEKKTVNPRLVYTIIGVVTVLVLGYLLISTEKPRSVKEEKKVEVKKEAPKKVAPKAAKQEAPKPAKDDVIVRTNRLNEVYKVDMKNTYRDERGILRFPGGARVPNPKNFERAKKLPQRSNIPKFKHRSESEIATLITIEPGGMLFGNPMYGDNFDKDFMASLEDPTPISEDDSERDRRIKELVNDAKKEMLERIKKGETPSEILKSEREELRRLSQYKSSLLSEVKSLVGDKSNSDQDVEDYLTAANEMLESKGIAPIKSATFIRNRQRYLNLTARREAEAAAAAQKKE